MSSLEPIPKAYANVNIKDLDKAFEQRQRRIRNSIIPNVSDSYLRRHVDHLSIAIDKLKESIKEAQTHIEELQKGAHTLKLKEGGFYVTKHIFDRQRKPWTESFKDNIKYWKKVISFAQREQRIFQRELKTRKPKENTKELSVPNIKGLIGL